MHKPSDTRMQVHHDKQDLQYSFTALSTRLITRGSLTHNLGSKAPDLPV